MDASEIINMQSEQDLPLSSGGTMSRAKSELSLGMNGCNATNNGMMNNTATTNTSSSSGSCSGGRDHHRGNMEVQRSHQHQTHENTYVEKGCNTMESKVRPKSIALSNDMSGSSSVAPTGGYARALYAYLSSGENQLSFLEGDTIALVGKSW